MYFMAKSCPVLSTYTVINFLQLPKPDQNMPYLFNYRRPVQNSVAMGKFHGSAQNSVFRGKLSLLTICLLLQYTSPKTKSSITIYNI